MIVLQAAFGSRSGDPGGRATAADLSTHKLGRGGSRSSRAVDDPEQVLGG